MQFVVDSTESGARTANGAAAIGQVAKRAIRGWPSHAACYDMRVGLARAQMPACPAATRRANRPLAGDHENGSENTAISINASFRGGKPEPSPETKNTGFGKAGERLLGSIPGSRAAPAPRSGTGRIDRFHPGWRHARARRRPHGANSPRRPVIGYPINIINYLAIMRANRPCEKSRARNPGVARTERVCARPMRRMAQITT